MGSSGIDAGDKEKWDIFHFGPKFLYLPKSEWPTMNIATAPEASINAVATGVGEEEEGEKEREMFAYSVAARRQEWVAKLRLIAVIVKCAQRWRQSEGENKSSDINAAKFILCFYGQRARYAVLLDQRNP